MTGGEVVAMTTPPRSPSMEEEREPARGYLLPKLAVVTASVDPTKTKEYWRSWRERAAGDFKAIMVVNGGPIPSERDLRPLIDDGRFLFSTEILGTVPAFAWGAEKALREGAEIIACFHDDLRIDEDGWDLKVREWFRRHPQVLLAGFGGALKLGEPGMYEKPYDPMTLARHDFISNMRDAVAHGRRVEEPTQVSVLDGFSLIGRPLWMLPMWRELQEWGVVHHAYDCAFGGFAARVERASGRGQVWMLPVKCHHAGGVTAVGSRDYQEWARAKHPQGDQGFWQDAHRIVWEKFRDTLPVGW